MKQNELLILPFVVMLLFGAVFFIFSGIKHLDVGIGTVVINQTWFSVDNSTQVHEYPTLYFNNTIVYNITNNITIEKPVFKSLPECPEFDQRKCIPISGARIINYSVYCEGSRKTFNC